MTLDSVAVEGGRRFEGDCFEIMPLLEPVYDLVLTDPPYAMPATYYQGRNETRRWSDSSIMARWFEQWVDCCVPVMKPTGTMLIFCDTISAAVFVPALYPRFGQVGSMVWDKGSIGMGSPIRKQHEWILFGYQRGGWARDKATPSVLSFSRVSTNARVHPAEKPVPLLKNLIEFFCPPEGRVLDPFAGSGATAKAAGQAGRTCDLIEMDPADTKATLLSGRRARA